MDANSRRRMPDASFWRGRKVFLTGHTGFKGSWLSLWLHSLGANLTGYALPPPTQPNLFEQVAVTRGMHSIIADVRDFQRLMSAIEECRPEVVIHMAAQSVVRRGYDDPIETYSSNIMGTVHLLEAIRQVGDPCAIVNVTSDKCYANREWVWGYRETEPLGGGDPYSNSKACAELVTASYREAFFPSASHDRHGVAIASARAGNVVGGGDWTCDQLIPDLIRAFQSRKPCLIRNPSAIRPWQFILEPLRGYLLLAERLAENADQFGSAWNFGPAETDAKTVSWVASRLAQLWGNGATWANDTQPHMHEAHHLKLDASKAKDMLHWHPILPLNAALEWIVEWYRKFQLGSDLRTFTLSQIEKYQSLACD